MEAKLYKNWPAICKLGDPLLVFLLATLDMANKSASRLLAAFPECFIDKEVQEQFPWSVINREVDREVAKDTGGDGQKPYSLPLCQIVLERFHVPYIMFAVSIDALRDSAWEPLPSSVLYCQLGLQFDWNGRKMVIINNDDCSDDFILATSVGCINFEV